MRVTQNLYRLDGEQPSNNPSTSARHPAEGDEIVGAAWQHAEGGDKEPCRQQHCNPEDEMIRDFETKQLKWSGYGAWSVQVIPEWRWLIGILPS